MPEFTVHQLDVTTAGDWAFRDSSLTWHHRAAGWGGRYDPFPAYAHDAAIAAAAADRAAALCPPLYDIQIHLANREEIGRTNGFSTNCYPHRYVDGERVVDPPLGLIVLSGKRVPPHPAITKYLIGHEYGHHVCWMLGKLRGATHLQDDAWLSDYAALRGLAEGIVRHGSGGRWHTALEEIFACDFRIMALDIEPDYWPHPGIAHPHDVHALHNWWPGTVDELRDAAPIT